MKSLHAARQAHGGGHCGEHGDNHVDDELPGFLMFHVEMMLRG